MLFKFPKYSQLLHSSLLIFLIFILITKFVDSNPTDKEFIKKCKKIYNDLKVGPQFSLISIIQLIIKNKSRIEMSPAPAPSTTIITYLDHPLVVSKEKFNQWFVMEEMKFLAEAMYKIRQKPEKKFDDDVTFAKIVLTNGIKDTEKYIQNWKRQLDGNPREFFPNLDKFLWKINDENLEKIEKKIGKIYSEKFPPLVEYDGGENHSTGNVMFAEEYIEARKIINEFIKMLKIEIVYGQGIGAIK